jgi:hypothetical protein
MSLYNLQQKVLAERTKILQELDDEYDRKKITEKLNSIYEELKKVDGMLTNIHRNTQNSNTQNKSNGSVRAAASARLKTRKRENPEFKRLGIPVPASQRPGANRLPLGMKIKKNRRTRRTRYE